MKARLIGFAAACALALALGAVSAMAATKTVTIRVKGMKCANCASSVAKALKATRGVEDAKVSSEKGEAVVTFDDEKVTETKLREVIDGTGFKSEAE